jgi:hypothetical protein
MSTKEQKIIIQALVYYPFGLQKSRRHISSDNLTAILTRSLTHRDTISQGKRDTLRFAANANMTSDSPRLCPLDAQVGERILT